MKKIILHIIVPVILLIALPLVSSAQQNNLRSAYFLDGYTYNYRLNPAFAPERGFISFPAIGNAAVGLESNLALSTFLYPTTGGKLTTFLDDSVSDNDFLGALRERNNLNANLNLNLLAFGFRTGQMYHTLDFSLKGNANVNLPKDLFAFLKTSTSNGRTSWDMARLGMHADTYGELAYGFSTSFGKNLRIGARLKVLMGVLMADVNIDRLSLKMSGEEWAVSSHGNAAVSGPVTLGTYEGSNRIDFSQISLPEQPDEWLSAFTEKKSMGVGLDLGASYDFLDYFTASFSILDLGFIGWNNVTEASTPESTWRFDGFKDISINDESTLSDHFDQMLDDATQMIQLNKTLDGAKSSKSLGATVHAGIEARLPFYERLSFGLLASHRFKGTYSWTEGRLSANWAPVNVLSFAASGAYSNYGASLGAVLNIHIPVINLYIGLDSFSPMLNVTPDYYIPIGKINTNLVFGLDFTFGKARSRLRGNLRPADAE